MEFIQLLSNFLVNNFWKIWAIIPTILVFYGLFFAYKYGFKFSVLSTKLANVKKSEPFFKLNAANLILLGLFLLFLSFYIYLILYKADFAYYDNYNYTHFTLRKVNYPIPIWRYNGRFFPLGHQEFNLIKFLTQSPTGYHAFGILQLLIVMAGVFLILEKFPVQFRILVATLIAITPSFVTSFFGLIFPERNVIFWLTIFLVCFQYFLKTRSRIYVCGALIAAQFALYYKEPVFLLIGGFAATGLLGYGLSERSLLQSRGYWQFFKTHCVKVGLLILTVLYLLLYVFIFLPNINVEYSDSRSVGIISVMVYYLKSDPLLDVFLIVIISRFFYLIYSRKLPDYFWDSLGIGTFLYFLSYIKLQILGQYYMAPVDFIAILYLAQLVYPWFQNKKVVLGGFATLVICVLVGQNIANSSKKIILRKNIIDSKVKLTQFLKDYSEQYDRRNVTLFFPYADGYYLMELSAFMKYKGLRIAKKELPKYTDEPMLAVKGPHQFDKYNRCVYYSPFYRCFQISAPQPGDLIVVLPDDKYSIEELTQLKREATLLFEYQPLQTFPKKILTIFFKFQKVPDNWFHAYVFQKS